MKSVPKIAVFAIFLLYFIPIQNPVYAPIPYQILVEEDLENKMARANEQVDEIKFRSTDDKKLIALIIDIAFLSFYFVIVITAIMKFRHINKPFNRRYHD